MIGAFVLPPLRFTSASHLPFSSSTYSSTTATFPPQNPTLSATSNGSTFSTFSSPTSLSVIFLDFVISSFLLFDLHPPPNRPLTFTATTSSSSFSFLSTSPSISPSSSNLDPPPRMITIPDATFFSKVRRAHTESTRRAHAKDTLGRRI